MRKSTLPVGVDVAGATGSTLAVMLPLLPYSAVGLLDASLIVVFARLTIWGNGAETTELPPLLGTKVAVIGSLPASSALFDSDAFAFLTVAVPRIAS